MFRKRDPQVRLFGSEVFLPPVKRARLDRSWAGPFRTRALPLIDEESFRPLFDEGNGRPNKPMQTVVGLLILKEMFNLTDEGTLELLEFSLQWQHALGLTPEEAHTCQKTLHNTRVRLIKHDGARLAFEGITAKIIEALGTKVVRQRLDSTHIVSNIAILTRLGLFCETLRVCLAALLREDRVLFEEIPERLRRRYLKDDGSETRYRDAKSDQAQRRLSVCARDAYRLVERFRGTPVAEFGWYALLTRLLGDQCEIVEEAPAPKDDDDDVEAERVPVVLRAPKKIASDSLQSPHDPDVTYSGHKGKGYEVQVAETCHPDNAVEIITHVEVTPSAESDASSTIPVLADLHQKGLTPTELVADTTYGSTENVFEAEAMGTELISPVSGKVAPPTDEPEVTGNEEPKSEPAMVTAAAEVSPTAPSPATQAVPSSMLTADDFDVPNWNERPGRCPAGHQAVASAWVPHRKRALKLSFDLSLCAACPSASKCPTKTKKGAAVITVDLHKRSLDRRRAAEASGAFKARYDIRAGIEATNSELKRAHGLNDVRVRSAPRVTLAVYFKALACNVKRMLRVLLADDRRAEAATAAA